MDLLFNYARHTHLRGISSSLLHAVWIFTLLYMHIRRSLFLSIHNVALDTIVRDKTGLVLRNAVLTTKTVVEIKTCRSRTRFPITYRTLPNALSMGFSL